MLLPYYIASMNIEHAYFEATKTYLPFEGICLVDTFQIAEDKQKKFEFFNEANSERVARQKRSPITVIIGNPPYNAWQQDENDTNKNRKYPTLDKLVRSTYGNDSQATNTSALSDPYVKAFRFASDEIKDEGIVAFVTNSGFIDSLAADGMRKHLTRDFDAIYVLNLGGNVRTNPKLSGTTHNVFGIQVGVAITFLVKHRSRGKNINRIGVVYYAATGVDWKRKEKYQFLRSKDDSSHVEWQIINPDKNYTWLTDGLDADFNNLIPLIKGTSTKLSTYIFRNCGPGLQTNRDDWVYNPNIDELSSNVGNLIDVYNHERIRWHAKKRPLVELDAFVTNDGTKIKWSSSLKQSLDANEAGVFDATKIRSALYRPFTKRFIYFDSLLNHRQSQLAYIFPNKISEQENCLIWMKVAKETPFFVLTSNRIVDLLPQGGSQCFAFYTYNEDGTNRRENIPDATQIAFWKAYGGDESISKWDIFHYVYGLLHHPGYRTRFAANLKRELPRVPFAPDFRAFAEAGRRLTELHVGYEQQPEFPLARIENRDVPLDWRVERMRLSADKRALVYNDFLTLSGIPPEAFAYRLGNRSALEWVVDQYQVSTDARSGLVSDPNPPDDEQAIVRLVGQVITVSLETQQIVAALPTDLGVDNAMD